jgi:hypothetical protein
MIFWWVAAIVISKFIKPLCLYGNEHLQSPLAPEPRAALRLSGSSIETMELKGDDNA